MAWGTTASIVRASILAIGGKEPPLESFIPKPYLPEHKPDPVKDEALRKLAKIDAEIMANMPVSRRGMRLR